ncbi:MAG TPA: hypothetical protein VFB60_22530 [Ktedonobacteraceae bacterium]|nr:hypothetical protein [Ktedonobacteraceae bacterium]
MHLSKREAQEDIAQLVQLLTESHPDPYSGMGGPLAFHREVAHILDSLSEEGITDTQLLRLLRPFVAGIHDGHTAIFPRSDAEEKEAVRLWLDWEIVEEQFYVAAVYREEDRSLLGARLKAVEGIAFAELVERMKHLKGYDNAYWNLINLKFAFIIDSLFLLELLQWEDLPQSLHLSLWLPDDSEQDIEIPSGVVCPGERIEPPTRTPTPTLNAAEMGWCFLDEQKQVACLRVDTLMRYREMFEFWDGIGYLSSSIKWLDETVRRVLPEEKPLPERVEDRLALVPSATELLRDLFGAMCQARTLSLLVDLRACPGGTSFFNEILKYFLYGTESVFEVEDSYQVPRYSPLFFSLHENKKPEDPEFQNALMHGGYDFTDENGWKERKRDGITAQEKERAYQDMKKYIDLMPTFLREIESREWEKAWTPRVTVLTSAMTSSAAFTVLIGLLRHGAKTLGVPSMQAGNCFIDALSFKLAHSELQGHISYKWSLSFPDDPERGKLLRPDYELTYQHLLKHQFDPHTTVQLALEQPEI